MTVASSSTSSPHGGRVLVIGESDEAAYRYAGVDAADVELAVGLDGAAAVDGPYTKVVVSGFAATPDVLRSVVDRAFELATPDGQVLVGSGVGAIAPDQAAWELAFAGLRVIAVDRGSFPSVELSRGAEGSAGRFLAGALSVLSLMEPWPRPEPERERENVAAPLVTPQAAARRGSTRKQELSRLWRKHSKRIVVAACAGLVALAISVGLVSIFGEYLLAVLLTVTLLAVLATAFRQEQHGRQIQRRLGRLESAQSRFREKLTERNRLQAKDITQIQRAVGVTQLAVLDAARALQRLEDQPRRQD